MGRFLTCLWRAIWRVYPHIPQTQAIAFNMFLSFLPMLLVLLGMVASTAALRAALLEGVAHLSYVLPPGSDAMLTAFLTRPGSNAWAWISLGLAGTLLVGTQMMRLIIIGFAMVYGDKHRIGFWPLNLRALLLLVITIVPALLTVHLLVFGNQMRALVARLLAQPSTLAASGGPSVAAPDASSALAQLDFFWSIAYFLVALGLAMGVLALVYHIGRPETGGWRSVLPGASLATALWWLTSRALGFYIRHVPYSAVYGGLAVAIGLMLWMEFTATIILVGAAFNAEWASAD